MKVTKVKHHRRQIRARRWNKILNKFFREAGFAERIANRVFEESPLISFFKGTFTKTQRHIGIIRGITE